MRAQPEQKCRLRPRGEELLAVAFAGIRFEIEAPGALLEAVSAVPQLFDLQSCILQPLGRDSGCRGGTTQEVLASGPSVHLRLREVGEGALEPRGPHPSRLGARDITWQWHGESGRALTLQSRAAWQVVHSKLDAEGELLGTPRAAESLLTALASAVLHRTGGAVLHAASVELPWGVVAFIGPSGAGKSTACRHLRGAKPFSIDRLAVLPARAPGEREASPSRRAWLAAPLPGGTGISPPSERGAAHGRPLALVLRVRHAKEQTALAECARIDAVATLRACAFHAGADARTELELLARLEQLAKDVPVAQLQLLLGTELEPVLGSWLARRSSSPSSGSRDAAA